MPDPTDDLRRFSGRESAEEILAALREMLDEAEDTGHEDYNVCHSVKMYRRKALRLERELADEAQREYVTLCLEDLYEQAFWRHSEGSPFA